ncbi:ATP-binding protein [Promicromonospora sp. NPDC090134]|uniref:ATP-binding protein n=1 Tax=Promicromonospora sp. NPDC090134 TaxID=3364408 RepID=UPI003818053A
MTYAPRAIDPHLVEMLAGLPAVAVEGPKAVGKTATAARLARTIIRLDREDEVELLAVDPGRLSRGPAPVLVDEWQLMPQSWDLVRRAVDDGAGAGAFLLTGSATPRARTHSGAGRIVRVRMRPMSFAERQIESPTVSFAGLLADGPAEIGGRTEVALEDYAEEIVRSGFPAIRGLEGVHRRDALESYLTRIVDHDFSELGHVVRRPRVLEAWLTAYAAVTGTTATYESILDAATQGIGDKPTRPTTAAYRDTLERLWILDEVPAWVGSRNRLASLTQASKHFLADPALAARLLGVGAGALIDTPQPGKIVARDGTLLGALFEHLVALSVRVHAEVERARVLHLRTKGGEHEVDLIVERDDGKVLAIEIKLNRLPTDKDVRHLRWLKEKLGDDLVDAVVVTTGPLAYRRPQDGIAVVPLALLGP